MGKKSKRRGQQSQAGPCCSEACCDYVVDKDVLVACQKIFECKYIYFQNTVKFKSNKSPYFTFNSLFLSLLLEGCYFNFKRLLLLGN